MNSHRLLCSTLLALVLLLAADSCNPKSGKSAQSSAANQRGASVYASSHCDLCHGEDRTGKPGIAPTLNNLAARWPNSAELEKYLIDPQGYRQANPRLSAQQGSFSMRMPALPLTDDDRKALAEWLLAQ